MKPTISALLLPLACALPLTACDKGATTANHDALVNEEQIGDSTDAAADRAMAKAEKTIDASAAATQNASEKLGQAAGRAGAAVRDATKDAAGSASQQADRIATDAQGE